MIMIDVIFGVWRNAAMVMANFQEKTPEKPVAMINYATLTPENLTNDNYTLPYFVS